MIELPKDAEGREIPLDTSELFIADGTKVRALRFEYMYHTSDAHNAWFVYIERTPGEYMTLHACNLHLIQPDSWEKLDEDLDKDICDYFEECPAAMNGKSCSECKNAVLKNIASRIRKLRGEDE